MNIFLCHSGNQSLKVAEALYYWLPRVLQNTKPFISNEGIPKGQPWMKDLGDHLEKTSIGIICLTPENLRSTWIHFEAGALFKGSGESHICTYLFDVEERDVAMPLSYFQLTKAEKEDTFRLIKKINLLQNEQSIPDDILNDTFEKFWDF